MRPFTMKSLITAVNFIACHGLTDFDKIPCISMFEFSQAIMITHAVKEIFFTS